MRVLPLSVAVALVLGLSPSLRADEAEDKAVVFFEKLGGVIGRSDPAAGKLVVAVALTNTKVTDTQLKMLGVFKNLKELFLDGTPIGDAGLKELAGLKNLQAELRELNVSFTKVSDTGVKQLAAFKNLQVLDLSKTGLTEKGLKELAALKKLEELLLTFDEVGDAGLKELAALTNLKTLNIMHTKVTAAGVQELQKALPKCKINR